MILKKIISILLLLGVGHFPSYSVDILEVNTHYDKNGNPAWRQLIAWRRFEDGKLHNVGWKFINKLSDFPVKTGNYWSVSVINDYNMIHVISPCIMNSHTQSDPEREDNNSYWKDNSPNIFVNRYNKITVEYE